MFLRFYILCLFALFYAHAVSAQQTGYTLTGDMGIQGGELFTYKLVLKDSVGNYLSGYAYTYLTEGKEVKATVSAQVDRAAKTLRIQELSILENRGFKSKTLICLVESELKFDTLSSVLSGPLTSHTAILGAECAKGSITFMQKAELDRLFGTTAVNPVAKDTTLVERSAQQPPKPQAVRIVYDTASALPQAVAPEAHVPRQITAGKDETFRWESDTIIMEIWDGNKVDNDRVRIEFNGVTVLDDFSISKDKKILSFPVGGSELNIIAITALNEGNEPPNTVNVLLRDGAKTYEVIAYNSIGKKSLIRISKRL